MKNNPVIVRPFARLPVRARQRGVALFVVLMIVILSMLLALWASRTSLFSEMVVGNDADYQRAFEAAQALEQDAKLDILGQNPDGNLCVGNNDVCRQTTAARIPGEAKDVAPLIIQLADTRPTQCVAALCARRAGRQDFWNNDGTITPAANNNIGEATLEDMQAVGARYGQYTGAGTGNATAPINPILANRNAGEGGWYWIEVLPYNDASVTGIGDSSAGTAQSLPLYLVPSVVYRITSIAFGRRPGTKVVLQTTFVKKKNKGDEDRPRSL